MFSLFFPQGTPREVVSISNMGESKRGPIIESRDHLLLEFTGGSVCMSDGLQLTYTTRIHLVCSRGSGVSDLSWLNLGSSQAFPVPLTCFFFLHCPSSSQSLHPQFLMMKNCTATFRWETRAACAITTTENNVSFSQVGKSWNVMTRGSLKTFPLVFCRTAL